MPIAVYPSEALPDTFSYPPEYIELASRATDLYPWWLIDASSETGRLMYRTTLGAGRLLVPFAKTDLYDDIACFNAATPSSNAEVIMVCSTPERSYRFADFAAWYAQAVRDASDLSSGGT